MRRVRLESELFDVKHWDKKVEPTAALHGMGSAEVALVLTGFSELAEAGIIKVSTFMRGGVAMSLSGHRFTDSLSPPHS